MNHKDRVFRTLKPFATIDGAAPNPAGTLVILIHESDEDYYVRWHNPILSCVRLFCKKSELEELSELETILVKHPTIEAIYQTNKDLTFFDGNVLPTGALLVIRERALCDARHHLLGIVVGNNTFSGKFIQLAKDDFVMHTRFKEKE